MRIIVNHLTRMQPGYICVAGIDFTTGKHVRPVATGRLTASLLARNGGPFDMGCEVELGAGRYIGEPPEVEDYQVAPQNASRITVVPAETFWKHLEQLSCRRLGDVFGPDLTHRDPHSCIVKLGHGRASLGCLVPIGWPNLYVKARENRPTQLRMRLSDGEFDADLSVTDIRLYQSDHVTPDRAMVTRITKRIQRGVKVILSVGLTRPFAPSPDSPEVHWLQVNNLHLADEPLWQLL